MAVERLVGVVLVLAGAFAATATMRHFERRSQSQLGLLALIPLGVIIGAGAAVVRDWNLLGSAVAGGVAVPTIAAAGRLWEVRRLRGSR